MTQAVKSTSEIISKQLLPRPATTAAISPQDFEAFSLQVSNKHLFYLLVACIIGLAFCFRVFELGVESFGEDEFNKFETIQEYRQKGLTGRNGEHPFLMKGLQTVSVSVGDFINRQSGQKIISDEAALRLPSAFIGTLTTVIIFLLVTALFGNAAGIIAAALWAVDPTAISFDRIAKEDSFLLFFFLLGNYLLIKSQTGASQNRPKWIYYAYASAVAFGAMLASKYLPHLLAVGISYNVVMSFPGNKWKLGTRRWIIFLFILGMSFIIFNPTLLLPETWREMLIFGTENRIGHDSYEFLGKLYENRMTAWLAGVPWYFYYVFIASKTSVITLFFFLLGLPFLFSRRLGDGRYLLYLWAFMWFLPFTFLGGKFTRYFAVAEPLILITAAIGIAFSAKKIISLFSQQLSDSIVIVLALITIATSFVNSVYSAPHYRLFTNAIFGNNYAGKIFPHDEFYDAGIRDAAKYIANQAQPHKLVLSETPQLMNFYLKQSGRDDLANDSLSSKAAVQNISEGDLILLARGRRYKSNIVLEEFLREYSSPASVIKVGETVWGEIYIVDLKTLAALRDDFSLNAK